MYSENNKCDYDFLELLVVKFCPFHKLSVLQIAEEKLFLCDSIVESYLYISPPLLFIDSDQPWHETTWERRREIVPLPRELAEEGVKWTESVNVPEARKFVLVVFLLSPFCQRAVSTRILVVVSNWVQN